MKYYQQKIPDVLKHLNTNKKRGLTEDEVKKRLKEYGKNELPKARIKITRMKIFLNQWRSPLLIILLVAGLISGLLGEYTDMTVILITAGLNAVIGFIQEGKANKALEKLQEMVEYKAVVLRDGERKIIKSIDIVPGDILSLEAGDKIQADGRIIEYVDFEVHEAALTGESESIKKYSKVISDDTVVADRKNMAYRGTIATNGHALIIVTKTGEETEIGKIATLVKDIEEEQTPLQTQIKKLSKMIGIVVIFLSLGIFFLGIFTHSEANTFELFETAVAVAVAAIPEGLVISLTVILAIGMQFILKRRGLVRKLVSAETLGSVSVICTDKTGTLTAGQMHMTHLVTKTNDYDADELKTLRLEKEKRHPEAILALHIGVLCNNATFNSHNAKHKDDLQFVGDTTEIALADMALRAGIKKSSVEKVAVRIAEVPFDSLKKYMATLHQQDGETFIYAKGAPEVILDRCNHYQEGGKTHILNKEKRTWFEKQEKKLTGRGLRVLGLAFKKTSTKKKDLKEEGVEELVFVGFAALSDPIRPEVKETIEVAKRAGIKIIMVTGDHVRTAQAIAKEIGIPAETKNIIDGEQLQKIDDKKLQKIVGHVTVFARVDPRDKVRIVDALKKNDEVVAMTGDGVNDAPALKSADIGVAVGSATDVAKEISDLVILDNRFSTIVAAVEQGRTIYQNIKKVILYLLSGSFTEVILIASSLIAGLPLAVTAVQILWVNLIEDSLPNMALAFDKGDKENMDEPPRKKGVSLLDKEMKVMILIMTIMTNLALFLLFLYYWRTTGDIILTRTIIFVALGIDSLFFIFSVRSLRHMIWQMNPFENKYVIGAVVFGLLMLVGAVYLTPLQTLLKTIDLTLEHWLILIGFGLLNIISIETVKGIFLVRRHRKIFS